MKVYFIEMAIGYNVDNGTFIYGCYKSKSEAETIAKELSNNGELVEVTEDYLEV